MGWYYTDGASRADIIREITTGWTNPETGANRQTLRHTAVGNVLWTLNETVHAGEVPAGRPRTERWIGCHLLSRSRDGWGYKPMDETMGPHYWSCPLAYLDAATEPANEYAKEWRAKARQWHAAKAAERAHAKTLKVGDRITVAGIRPNAFQIVSLKPATGRADDGRLYRLTRRVLGRAVVAA